MLVNDLVELGELIRRRRAHLGLSQTELAEQVGGTRQWVSRLEKGKNDISTARLFTLLDALELNLDLRPPANARASQDLSPRTTSILPTESLNAISRSLKWKVELPRTVEEALKNISTMVEGLRIDPNPISLDPERTRDDQTEKSDAQP